MTELVPITSELTAEYRAVRLRALQDNPLAFGSTYEREVRLTDEEWRARATRCSAGRDVGFLAQCDGEYTGLALCFVDAADTAVGQLISMWVAPEARRSGVGRMLIDGIVEWAREREIGTIKLMVTSVNDGAMEFYRRNGFAMTGKTEPYPNDPAVVEYEMVRRIGCEKRISEDLPLASRMPDTQ
jgi:ribosomal protein S18 acetylase RimI-like enzyme